LEDYASPLQSARELSFLGVGCQRVGDVATELMEKSKIGGRSGAQESPRIAGRHFVFPGKNGKTGGVRVRRPREDLRIDAARKDADDPVTTGSKGVRLQAAEVVRELHSADVSPWARRFFIAAAQRHRRIEG